MAQDAARAEEVRAVEMCRMCVQDARAVAAMARDLDERRGRRQRLLGGRMLHGVGLGRALRRAAGCVAWLIRAVVAAPLRRAFRQRRETLVLLSMNDRMLADIGLMRADVQGLAYGVIPVEHFARDPMEADGTHPVELPCQLPFVPARRLPKAA
jgi:uncharacterized protein YjiS (DUF1127 family)